MPDQISRKQINLLFFSVAVSLISYGYYLTNFTITIDSEVPFDKSMSLDLGRWGTNLITYQVFHGITPYFTLLLSLILLSASSVILARMFRFKSYTAYAFCALFITFPQMAYQLYFSMQSVAVTLSFVLSACAVMLFNNAIKRGLSKISAAIFIASALLIMCVIAIYQALVFIPVVIYLVMLFQNTYRDDFSFKYQLRVTLLFGLLMVTGLGFYLLSLPVLCPNLGKGGYLASYASGNTDSRFVDFYNIVVDNIRGDYFYGDKAFIFASVLCIATLVFSFIKDRKTFWPRALVMLFLLVVPFLISLFITGLGYYHPPRIYVTSGIVFAFFIAHFLSQIKFYQVYYTGVFVVVMLNIYFITRLYVSHQQIYNSDYTTVYKIDDRIRALYPDFDPGRDYVYFYGKVSDNNFKKFRLENSEIFSGSILQWDGGNNYRINGFINYTGVANYKIIDNKESYLYVKDSIAEMAVWPKPNSVKRMGNVVVVKLGNQKGSALWVE
ncbi:glucosyltransferase domain-containing protein [Flavobacterium sp. RHBU_24]|uniref:glucosyltransferase domain-containing protein n=1 Tax=Flavobacterium sp. RHBU_24 TaxID=3391185 RepID=UPI003984FDF7